MTGLGRQPVIVVGGGIAGMVFARDLARAGVRVVVLEASERLGGQVRGHQVGGIDLDAGAEAFATRTSAVSDLAIELGLGGDIVTPAPAGAWLYSRTGRARPLPETSLLGIPALPFDAHVRAIIGGTAAVRAAFDRILPAKIGADATTLGELVRARMGAAVVEKLVAPVTTGVHSAHPDDLLLDRVAPGLLSALAREGSLARAVRTLRERSVSGSAVAGIRGGMARLVEQLQRDLELHGVDIRVGARVSEVLPGGVRVDGALLSGAVVVAAPGMFAPAEVRSAMLVTLILDCAELDAAPRGSGVLVARGSAVQARALTHQTAKWPWLAASNAGRHVVRLSYEVMPTDPAETARKDAAALLGVAIAAGQVMDFTTVTWERAMQRAAIPDVIQIGEETAGTGLAAVVQQAREQAARFLSRRVQA